LTLHLNSRSKIDNNLVEKSDPANRPWKKNWLFFGDANAGERSAVIYSIIESCRRHGVESNAGPRGIVGGDAHLWAHQLSIAVK
jgi:transposase